MNDGLNYCVFRVNKFREYSRPQMKAKVFGTSQHL